MLNALVDFVSLFLMTLVVGVMFAVWLLFKPSGLDAATYVTRQQHSIRALNVVMPVLGWLTLLATIVAALFARGEPRFGFMMAAAACLFAAGLITRYLNQPINAIVAKWSPEAPAADWMRLRDVWWGWHRVRLVFGLAGLTLMLGAALSQAHS